MSVVTELQHLPSAPKVLPRLKRLLTDGNSTMHEIVTLIRLDQGISARVLQTANSAYYYNGGARCRNVDEAVNRVGFDHVYELVANAVAALVLVRPLHAYEIEPDELWKTSVACGLAAEYLAEVTGEDRDIAYTVGLLHNIGMLAIDEWVLHHHPGAKLTNRSWPSEAVESERALIGFTHAEAGGALLQHWEFPATMSQPVRWQYNPRSTTDNQRMACLLHTAKWIRTAVCSESGNLPTPAPDPWFTQPLQLSQKQLRLCVSHVKSELSSISNLLDEAESETLSISFPGATREFQVN